MSRDRHIQRTDYSYLLPDKSSTKKIKFKTKEEEKRDAIDREIIKRTKSW